MHQAGHQWREPCRKVGKRRLRVLQNIMQDCSGHQFRQMPRTFELRDNVAHRYGVSDVRQIGATPDLPIVLLGGEQQSIEHHAVSRVWGGHYCSIGCHN
ncbi:protein of unknown function [Acidithiobacillus ferrivorans]|uniref:Uncharacterized protein n=1 Tax=Acidithiobacillus ferrivorans TaxID=160808 RepID=A0A060UVJ5_9PROT|nr:hypothetical protein AFERRI_400345 [Acidithiobacillus ferrivorans]SMH64595.1 protein of unknown function [Acidithiobacillus ferrivorans]